MQQKCSRLPGKAHAQKKGLSEKTNDIRHRLQPSGLENQFTKPPDNVQKHARNHERLTKKSKINTVLGMAGKWQVVLGSSVCPQYIIKFMHSCGKLFEITVNICKTCFIKLACWCMSSIHLQHPRTSTHRILPRQGTPPGCPIWIVWHLRESGMQRYGTLPST